MNRNESRKAEETYKSVKKRVARTVEEIMQDMKNEKERKELTC